MSTASQIAVLPTSGRGARAHDSAAGRGERPLVRLAAFAALGLYGVLRWGTLLTPAPTGRLLGLLALAVLVAGLGGAVASYSRGNRRFVGWAAGVGAVIALLAVLALSGVPLAWIRHVRIAVTTNAIEDGLSALPQVLVPYNGINDWVRVVIVLGAGVLLLDAALVLAFTTRALGDLRRAGGALPLVALAVVPSTLARPRLPYVQGLLLFVLLAALIWGERIRVPEAATGAMIAGLAAVAAMIAAPALDQHKPWLNYEALTGTLSPAHVDTFAWNQTYGPLDWPQTGREIFDVQAAHPDYWKAENLDYFNGYSWVQAPVAQPQHPLDESAAAVRLYTQTIKVTIRGLDTTDVIAAGSALAPQDISAQVLPGASPGTWTTASTVQPGASYRVNVYAPAAIAGLYGPSATSLAAVGPALDPDLSAYLTVGMPSAVVAGAGVVRAAPVVFAPFHSRRPVASDATDGDVTTIRLMTPTRVQGTPYAQAFALAQRLARQAATPYAFVQSVLRYLSTANGFSYNQHPPSSRYPLESFLFDTKTGYCQQFSGAMALLLRMGGVPARVGAGFTTGTYDSAIKQYVVSDTDAHDWVEAWFAGYGWVAFDPTPAAAPARGGHAPLPAIEGADTSVGAAPLIHHEDVTPSAGTAARAARPHRSSSVVTVVALAVAAALVLVALAALAWRRAAASPRDPLGELERALARCGRPVADGVTLAALERRFGSSGDGAAYIRAIRLARFADGEQPTPEQRRALRAQLRAGLGVTGTLRALWALPPRWRRRIGSGSQSRGIH